MKSLQNNIFQPISVVKEKSLELIDVFDVQGKKTIELDSHSSLIYLVVGSDTDIDIQLRTIWPNCSCKIFGLFVSDAKHSLRGSIKISLNHSQTSVDVELISFLRDGAKAEIDGCIDIAPHLDHVYGRLLEHNIILGENIAIKTLPKLNVASHNVHVSHGANIDAFDQQKLFYMMSRGLTQKQSQTLLVNWYIEHVLKHFSEISDEEKQTIFALLKY